MLKRTITGAFYVAVLVGFFLLRQNVDFRIFHVLTMLFSILGSCEMCRAFKGRTIKGARVLAMISATLIVPVFVIGEQFIKSGWGIALSVDVMAISLIAISIVSLVKGSENNKFLSSVLILLYPTALLLAMLLANQLPNGFIALLMAFVVSPCSDTMAYLVGSLIGGPKLCPKLSPKKTWSGAVGGTIGGIIGGLIVYFIFTPTVNFFSPVLLFIIAGLLLSIVNVFGDLFESVIKRKLGIKDMGNILPGHGGILDRIDGTLFTTVLSYIIFALV